MKIRCKKTDWFICEIQIEDYLENLERLGISQEIPLQITARCKKCGRDHTYSIYKTHYIEEKDKNVVTFKK